MLRRTVHVLAASILLAAAGANAALQDITDGTSNTVLFSELGASAELTGIGKLKVGDVVNRGPATARIEFDTERGSLTLFLADDLFFTGRLVAGATGNRFRVFLDAGSRDRFTEMVADGVGPLADPRARAVAGEHLAFELTVDEASARFKMKAEVLTEGVGLVVLKANLSGAIGRLPER
jgi:hypothetical protein